MRYTFRSERLSCSSQQDLCEQLNEIDGEVLSVRPCAPEATDTNQWFFVYYKIPYY